MGVPQKLDGLQWNTPSKWMVYDGTTSQKNGWFIIGKSHCNGWFGGYPYFRKPKLLGCHWLGFVGILIATPRYWMGKALISGEDFVVKTNPMEMDWMDMAISLYQCVFNVVFSLFYPHLNIFDPWLFNASFLKHVSKNVLTTKKIYIISIYMGILLFYS